MSKNQRGWKGRLDNSKKQPVYSGRYAKASEEYTYNIGSTYIGKYLQEEEGKDYMASWGITSESQIRAQARYDAAHTIRISLKLNTGTDRDVISWLQRQTSKQGAIKQLIREKLAQTGK